MSLAAPAAPPAPRTGLFTQHGVLILPGLLLCAALFFNATLAAVNAQVRPLSGNAVVGAELAIVAAIQILALLAYRPQMRPWYALTAFLLLFSAFRAFGSGGLEVKFLRDALLIPTLILLGMTFRRKDLVRWVLAVHAIVLVFMLMEIFFTDQYAALFNIRDYYINTRGYKLSDFWNSESTLYVSASRPNDRIYLPFLNLHRVSSLFLEPVSLGNYCIIVTGFICAFYRRLGVGARIFLILGNIALIIACDGRLALVSSVLIVALSIVLPVLPRRTPFFYLPLTVGAAILLVHVAGLRPGGDDFPGRVAYTVDLLERYSALDFAGLSNEYISKAVDSGVAYLTLTQSILGLAVIWTFIALASREDSWEQRMILHAACIYISMNMLVSFAFLTIKTAALLWAVHGMLQVHGRDQCDTDAHEAR